MEGRAIDGTRASAGGRARARAHTQLPCAPGEPGEWRCMCAEEGTREEWRKRGKKAYQAKCARDLTRLDVVSRYETLRLPCARARSPYRGSPFLSYPCSHIFFSPPVSPRPRSRFISRFYSCALSLSLSLVVLYFKNVSRRERLAARLDSASLFPPFTFAPPRFVATLPTPTPTGFRVCIRRIAKPRRDIRPLQNWIVKVDINSWVFSDVVFSSLRLASASRRTVPKYAPAENSHDTPVMKLSRTPRPRRPSSAFIIRAAVAAHIVAPVSR